MADGVPTISVPVPHTSPDLQRMILSTASGEEVTTILDKLRQDLGLDGAYAKRREFLYGRAHLGRYCCQPHRVVQSACSKQTKFRGT